MRPRISEMLKELKQLDPEAYKNFYRKLNRLASPRNTANSTIRNILKSAIEKAIKDNGSTWEYQIASVNGNGKNLATIFQVIGKGDRRQYLGEGYSPAEALLSAYLMALKGDDPNQPQK